MQKVVLDLGVDFVLCLLAKRTVNTTIGKQNREKSTQEFAVIMVERFVLIENLDLVEEWAVFVGCEVSCTLVCKVVRTAVLVCNGTRAIMIGHRKISFTQRRWNRKSVLHVECVKRRKLLLKRVNL